MASSDDDPGEIDDDPRETNYLRLQLLMGKHATFVLQCKFDQYIPPDQLHTQLNSQMGRIKYALKNPRQKAMLQPSSRPPKSQDFDITLLTYLLRNICGLNTNSPLWECEDNSNIPKHNTDVIADIVRIRNLRNKLHHKPTASIEENEYESEWNIAEEAMIRLTGQCGIPDFKQKIDDVKFSTLLSEELRSLRANSVIFLEEYLDEDFFVETGDYTSVLKHLTENNYVVLTGHPGEGKTTMAARLALSSTPLRNCLVLKQASDWRHVDPSLKVINTIIIDDIFGAASLDENLLRQWKNILPEIIRAAKRKKIKVIITSRHYIFQESREELGSMFGNEDDTEHSNPVFVLASAKLSDEEKIDIFKSQARRNKKIIPIGLITECVMTCSEESADVLFGFPECVSMFVRHGKLYDKGAEFFKKPASLFKFYLQKMYRNRPMELRDKFLALVIVWSKVDKTLSITEVQRIKTISCHVKQVAEVFDRKVDVDFLETVKSSLESHVGGFLNFSDKSGQYTFSHNVIGDMVGLVIADRNPEQAIEICPRDFLMEYVGIGQEQENKVTLKERHYPCLAEKMTKMILREHCNGVPDISKEDFQWLMRNGKRQNTVKVYDTLDFGLIKHAAFKSKLFMDMFITYVDEHKHAEKMFQTRVMSMTGFLFDYGINIDQLDMLLLDYAWFIGARMFATEVFETSCIEGINNSSTVSLLLAVHSGDEDSVRYLLQNGARVTGDAIYIAIHKVRMEMLQILLTHPGTDVNGRGNAVNGNYPLMVASRKGFTDAVKCLLQYGADPGVKNAANTTALHNAIIYKNRDIIDVLVEKHAPLDIRGGKFKRTPLHIAVDIDDLELVKLFLDKGAPVLVKDHRGHYPIHIAAIGGHHKIVQTLLPVDKRQETHRISSYGKLSKIKGFGLYHIAVMQKDELLIKTLMEMGVNPNGTDWYGQTALYFAIMENQETIASLLLNYQLTDKKKPQKQGFTTLHAAIYKRLTNLALELIPHSDVNAQDKFGSTPLHVACKVIDTTVIDRLLDNGVDVNMVTKRGDTIFHILRRNMRKSNISNSKAKLLETYFAKYYLDLVQQLPMLQNKSGITIDVRATASGAPRPPFIQVLLEDSICKLFGGNVTFRLGDESDEGR